MFAAVWLTMRGDAVPAFGTAFAGFAIAGAITQMAGTILLIMAFGHRGFVVGTAFSKTAAVQAALVPALFLGERLPLLAWYGLVAAFGSASGGEGLCQFGLVSV